MRGVQHLLGAGGVPQRAVHAGGPHRRLPPGRHAHGAVPRDHARGRVRGHRPPHHRPPLRHHGGEHLPGARRHVQVPRQPAPVEEPGQQGPPLPRLHRLRHRLRALHQRHLLRRPHRVHPQGRAPEQPAAAAVLAGPGDELQHRLRRHAHRQPAEPRHRRRERDLLRPVSAGGFPGHDRGRAHQRRHPPLLLLAVPVRGADGPAGARQRHGARGGRGRRGHLAPVHAGQDVARLLPQPGRLRPRQRAHHPERQRERQWRWRRPEEPERQLRDGHAVLHQVPQVLQHVARDGGGLHGARPGGRVVQEVHQDGQPAEERHHRGRAAVAARRRRQRQRREGQGAARGRGEEVEGAGVEDGRVPHHPRHAHRPAHGAQHVLDRHHRRSGPPRARFHRCSGLPREGVLLVADLFLRDVHHGGRVQQDGHTQHDVGAGGALLADRQRKRRRASRTGDPHPLQCGIKCSNSSAVGDKGGCVGRGDFAGVGEEGMADTGVREHGGREPDAAGLGGEPDRVRAGEAGSVLRLQPLLLEPPPVRGALHHRRHRHRPAHRKQLLKQEIRDGSTVQEAELNPSNKRVLNVKSVGFSLSPVNSCVYQPLLCPCSCSSVIAKQTTGGQTK